MGQNKLILIVLSVIGIFAFVFGAYYATNRPAKVEVYPEVSTIKPSDNLKWSKAKKHVLVEYGDLECPACKSFNEVIKTLEADKAISGNITFVYRHFPLPVHAKALRAAHSAYAAGKQGKFYEYIDVMYENQETWAKAGKPEDEFKKYAAALKLNVEQFEKDMNSDEAKKVVADDQAQGNTVAVDATPTFYLDGEKIIVNSVDEFKQKLLEVAKK